ncbi:MAG: ShlB/FhaC/HecB family hemolysin secretion/activation protein [Oscillatoriales cyanobacterium RU_3_3]|nr:ShlB/FhaC/HecB family hemolysin secretion/activation protein [Oscillatoriales cyanobacterium RU_3_3]
MGFFQFARPIVTVAIFTAATSNSQVLAAEDLANHQPVTDTVNAAAAISHPVAPRSFNYKLPESENADEFAAIGRSQNSHASDDRATDEFDSFLHQKTGDRISENLNPPPAEFNREISTEANTEVQENPLPSELRNETEKSLLPQKIAQQIPNSIAPESPLQEQIRDRQIPNPITPQPPLPQPIPAPQPAPEPPFNIPVPAPVPPAETEIPGTVIIQRFEFAGNTAFSSEELAKVTAQFTNKPISFAELLQAEAAITKLYVDAGYINSGAVIPAGQNLSAGVVTIRIIEGGLQDIVVSGTGRLDPNYVRSRLAIAAGRPLNTNRLLQALQLLQLDPLIQNISAELTAGARPELSILEVRVKPARTLSAQLILDNGRSPSVGSFRRGIEFTQANTLGLGDALRVNYTNTTGSNAFDINYTLPVNPRNGTVSLSYGRTGSDVVEPPFDRLEIVGKSSRYELTYRQPVLQTASREFALGITASLQESRTTLLGESEPLSPGADEEGRTRVSAVRFFQEWTQRSPRSVLAARSQFSVGLGAFGATVNSEAPDSRFLAWRGQAQYVRLLAPETLFVARSDLQLANRALVPLEQIGLGGFRSVRGYRQDILLTDNGLLLSAEVQVPIARFGRANLLQVVPFVDYGRGWNSSGEDSPKENNLLGVGLGLQLRLGDRFTGRIEYGVPLIDAGNSDGNTWQEKGLYFSVIYNLF